MKKRTYFRATSICLFLSSVPFAAHAQTLSREAADDLARVFGPSPVQAERFSNAINIESLRLTAEKNSTCILPNVAGATKPATAPRDVFSEWHCLALNLLAVDHIPKSDPITGNPLHYQQFGPHRSSYAMAMFHLAMYEVANAFASQAHAHPSWISANLPGVHLKPPAGASEAAALVESSHRMLLHLYPHFQDDATYGSLDKDYQNALVAIQADLNAGDIPEGKDFGSKVADVIIGLRGNDGSQAAETMWFQGFSPKSPISAEYQWSPDPVSKIMVALGAHWGEVTPFMIQTPENFPLGAPITDHNDAHYKPYYDEVKQYGGDTRYSVNDQKDKQKYLQGKFWSYDGTAGVCAPVRLYNQIADTLLVKYYSDIANDAPSLSAADTDADADAVSDMAHYYEMLNVAMADAGIVAWKYKYLYQYWRPVTMIRYNEAQNPPSGGFGHEMLGWAPVWYALGAQNTNSGAGYNVTPPFPAYPSGHSVFGGAFFEVLRSLFNSDDKPFDFQSDELNGPQRLGKNVDAFNYVRCAKPTAAAPDPDYDPQHCDIDTGTMWKFKNLKDAEQQNSDSRVYLGVHWRGDTDMGTQLGNKIGYSIVKQQLATVGP